VATKLATQPICNAARAVHALRSDQYVEQITGDTMDSMRMETGNLLTGTENVYVWKT
jgi:hypothetical protein